uniref:Thioredoxin domain-containing protein n=1 Tax=Leersia perrieri TaxID=77586 RepID=A0A0D9XD32_9ORYZ
MVLSWASRRPGFLSWTRSRTNPTKPTSDPTRHHPKQPKQNPPLSHFLSSPPSRFPSQFPVTSLGFPLLKSTALRFRLAAVCPIMLAARALKLSMLRRLGATAARAAERLPPCRPRVFPARSNHSRGYSSEGSSKYNRPMRHFAEENETNSQPLIYYIVPSALLAFAGLVTFVHYNDEKRAVTQEAQQSSVPKRCTTNRPAIGGPFKLYDTENNEVTESKLRGNWTLIYFGYTSCPDVGPAEVQKMADAVKLLESKYGTKITPLFVTIDPQRDSPAQLKAYLSEFDPRIIGLTGTINAVRQIAQEYRVFFKKVDDVGQDYLVESSHNMYLLDPCLETARCFGTEYKASDLAEAITMEIQKASKSSTNYLSCPSWTQATCCHYACRVTKLDIKRRTNNN